MTLEAKNDRRRQLPAVARLMEMPGIRSLIESDGRPLVVKCIQDELNEIRSCISYDPDFEPIAIEQIVVNISTRIKNLRSQSIRPVINATGIILHTGLGRAVLPKAAIENAVRIATGHCNLEIVLETGERGDRQTHFQSLLSELTGAESSAVFNNNAAAVLIVMTALGAGKEVIVSRGELVEIGGSFRLPDIIRTSGATLVEIGTTNRTRLSDYAAAVNEQTAIILRCHPSNFRMVGFTEEAANIELAELCQQYGLILVDDLGSGALVDCSHTGLEPAVTVQQSLASGADLVTFSGDKMLGGPQAGIVVGKRPLIAQLISHPLARAIRVDKVTLALLEATLRLYQNPERTEKEIPTLWRLSRPIAELKRQAQRLVKRIKSDLPDRYRIEIVPSQSEVGGGSLPGQTLASIAVAISDDLGKIGHLAQKLRTGSPPVVGYIKENRLLLDMLTVSADEVMPLVEALRNAGASLEV
ncbi:MAG: L-seryl-tRNA(Sec) selenium transferase [Armatimonadetes bacterium]|nr:L-seryl-tRNA(Sec) selenium transferase [Armatimonadota bacterium]